MDKYSDEVAFLVAQTGPLNGQRWALRKSILVGRESTCEVVINDRQVSRHHARLTVTSDGIFLEDLGSKNGTYVNGRLVRDSILLEDGDIVQAALAQKFVFLSSDATLPLEGADTEMKVAPDMLIPIQAQAEVGRLHLEKRSRRVWVNLKEADGSTVDKEIIPPLSVSQFRLLELLYENQSRVVTRRDLIATVWGEKQAYDVSEQALDALIRRLRDRISNIDASHEYIITVRGHGLRLNNPPL
jgi:hypothetical protein